MAHRSRAKKRSVGVLFSAGLDSAALVWDLLNKGYTVWPVYIRCGLPWEKKETHHANLFLNQLDSVSLKPLKILNLSLEDSYNSNWSKRGQTPHERTQDESVFLPARNLLLVTKAFLYLTSQNVHTLALATLKGNPFEDAQPNYLKKLEDLLSKGFKRPLSVLTPFRTFTKKDVIRKSSSAPLHLSMSCIAPNGSAHCGKCNKCAERRRAFKAACIQDRTIYVW